MARNDVVKITKGDKMRLRPRKVAEYAVKNQGWHYADSDDAPKVVAPKNGDPTPTQAMLRRIATADAPWLDEQIGIWSIWTKAAQKRLDELAGMGGPRPAPDTPKDPPPPGPAPAPDTPKKATPPAGVHTLPAGEALKLITSLSEVGGLEDALANEKASKNRKTVVAAIEKKIKQLSK